MRRKFRIFAATVLFSPVGLVLLLLTAPLSVQGSESWHVTPGAGVLLFSGGQPVRDSMAETLRLGYDLDAPVSIELGGLAGGRDRDGTWADAILHLARWERFDPFLSAGVGAFWSDRHALPDNRDDGVGPRLGAGFLYSLSEHWSARAGVTVTTLRLSDRQSVFSIVEAGLSYYFGDTTPDRPDTAH